MDLYLHSPISDPGTVSRQDVRWYRMRDGRASDAKENFLVVAVEMQVLK
jgi:hypothetical protein